MFVTALVKAAAAMISLFVIALASLGAGLSLEGFLALIVAINGVELGLIVHNTARVSRLSGRYNATHPADD